MLRKPLFRGAFSLVGTGVLYLRIGWLPSLTSDWREAHSKARFSLMYQGQQGASLLKYAMLPALGGMAGGSVGWVNGWPYTGAGPRTAE